MEHSADWELFSKLRAQRKQRFTEEAAQFVAGQVVLALEYLHGFNIVYQGIQPENIMLDGDGYIVLQDQALAVPVIEYLPPEKVSANGYDESADWWMLGVLIYEMVSGRPPWSHPIDANQVYHAILESPVSFEPSISKSCQNLIAKLLRKDRKQRLQKSAQIKKHAWFKGLDWKLLYQKQVEVPWRRPVVIPDDFLNDFELFHCLELDIDSCEYLDVIE